MGLSTIVLTYKLDISVTYPIAPELFPIIFAYHPVLGFVKTNPSTKRPRMPMLGSGHRPQASSICPASYGATTVRIHQPTSTSLNKRRMAEVCKRIPPLGIGGSFFHVALPVLRFVFGFVVVVVVVIVELFINFMWSFSESCYHFRFHLSCQVLSSTFPWCRSSGWVGLRDLPSSCSSFSAWTWPFRWYTPFNPRLNFAIELHTNMDMDLDQAPSVCWWNFAGMFLGGESAA